MATTHDRLGGRTVELLIPFEHQGRKLDAVSLKPVLFDHVLRWQKGAFGSSLALLSALSGENENVLRLLRYPDVDRVLEAMMGMLPDPIRNDISNGVIPQPQPEAVTPPGTNGLGPVTPNESFAGIDDK